MFLHTRRLLLRNFNASDLEAFLAYRNDPAVAKYQSWDVPYPREKGDEFIAEMGDIHAPKQGHWLQLALELKERDTFESANEKPLVQKAITLYRSGFRRMLRIDSWTDVKQLITLFNKKVLDFNSDIEPLMSRLTTELLVNRTTYRLKTFLQNING